MASVAITGDEGLVISAMQIEGSWTDGWLLMALLLAQEGETGARLHALIAAADAINHIKVERLTLHLTRTASSQFIKHTS